MLSRIFKQSYGNTAKSILIRQQLQLQSLSSSSSSSSSSLYSSNKSLFRSYSTSTIDDGSDKKEHQIEEDITIATNNNESLELNEQRKDKTKDIDERNQLFNQFTDILADLGKKLEVDDEIPPDHTTTTVPPSSTVKITKSRKNNKSSSSPSSMNNDESSSSTSSTTNPQSQSKSVENIVFKMKSPEIRPRYSVSDELMGDDKLTPKEIVSELDKYIIGQAEAKRAVSIALRNRWRRKRLDPSIKQDVYPKNILMIGPTGVGKTEIARRLANIVNAPFIKVEATKYTEVGFHGPDVDSIIRDLIEVSIHNIKQKIANLHKETIDMEIEKEIISSLVGPDFLNRSYEDLVKLYREKALENIQIELDVPSSAENKLQLDDENLIPFAVSKLFNVQVDKSNQTKKRIVTVSEARTILEKIQREKLIVQQDVTKLAIQSAEQNGIVFLDEIDKICTPKENTHRGGDASTDGVQRDLLPIIEGCNVNTKYGMIDTSRILFIASGAFHSSKPSDLISELQGRLPIRVELKPLDQNDFYRILTEPKNNQIQQQTALLQTEDITLEFTTESLREVSRIAFDANAQVQNIGARRLHGIIEKIVEEYSFNCDEHKGKTVVITEDGVRKHLSDLLLKTDLSKYII